MSCSSCLTYVAMQVAPICCVVAASTAGSQLQSSMQPEQPAAVASQQLIPHISEPIATSSSQPTSSPTITGKPATDAERGQETPPRSTVLSHVLAAGPPAQQPRLEGQSTPHGCSNMVPRSVLLAHGVTHHAPPLVHRVDMQLHTPQQPGQQQQPSEPLLPYQSPPQQPSTSTASTSIGTALHLQAASQQGCMAVHTTVAAAVSDQIHLTAPTGEPIGPQPLATAIARYQVPQRRQQHEKAPKVHKPPKPQPPSPTHFLALRVSHSQPVREVISTVQAALVGHSPGLEGACEKPVKAHITLGVMHLPDDVAVQGGLEVG